MFSFPQIKNRVGAVLLAGSLSPFAAAETWTDATGRFSIEAKFIAVEGRSVVLEREDGRRISVPISRLSAESRAQGKALYEKMRSANPFDRNSGNSAGAAPATDRNLSFRPPEPPSLDPLPPFPDNLSLEQTVEFIETQYKAGHPEVFWYALPEEMRQSIDNQRVRKAISPFVKKQLTEAGQLEQTAFKAIGVFVAKKQFVLGSPMFDEAPPEAKVMIQKGYDSGVGLAYEVADLVFSLDSMEQRSIGEMVDYYGPRIGGHMSKLLALAPDGMIDSVLDTYTIEQIDANNAVLKAPPMDPELLKELSELPDIEGDDFDISEAGLQDVAMTRHNGRWLPKDLVDNWDQLQGMLSGDVDAAVKQVEQASAEQVQGAKMMVGMMVGMVNTVLDSLMAANTQEEFNEVFAQSAGMLNLGGGEDIEFEIGGEDIDLQMHEDEGEAVEYSGEPPKEWTLDLSDKEIPSEPARGIVAGREFQVDEASLGGGILKLIEKDARGFSDQTSCMIFLFDNEPQDGKTYNINPKTGFDSPHVHLHWEVDGEREVDSWTDGYAMRLEFGKSSGKMLPYKIYLSLNDKYRSVYIGEGKVKVP